MRKPQIALLAALLAIAALVVALTLRNRQPPYLPHDADHARFVTPQACLVCHGVDGGAPRGPNHPPSDDCMRCHGVR